MLKKNQILYFFFIPLSGFFLACSQISGKNNLLGSEHSDIVDIVDYGVENYNAYVENPDHGLVIQKNIEDMRFRAFYTPIAYLAAKETETSSTSDTAFKKAYDELYASNLQYITLQLTVESKSDPLLYKIKHPSEIEERIKYYSFEVNNDIKLEDGGISLPCVLHHYERSFGITNNITISLAFPKTDNSTDKVLIFDDKVYNKGVLKIKFKKENLNALLTDFK